MASGRMMSVKSANTTNSTDVMAAATEPKICDPGGSGLFFPLFESEQYVDKQVRSVIYVCVLLYLFVGVSVVADKFMEAIERITSRKKIVRMRHTGRLLTIDTWNGTLANLTLLALGASAPEILLSIVEIFINNFYAGDLGPGTMIGSAAFNLCCIVAVSCVSIPNGEIRAIKYQAVFIVTVFFALFAYAWLCFIVQINTPDVITIGEGCATIGFYPILLVLAYLAHIGFFSKSTKPKERHIGKPMPSESGDPHCIRDASGQPICNPNGVITFADDMEYVEVGLEERVLPVKVQRKNGTQGDVSCKYRMESRTAVPSRDFLQDEGDIVFPHGVDEAVIPVTLLPKRLGEHDDQFQIILEEVTGGAVFNPNSDGKEEKCVLTMCILNDNNPMMQGNSLMRVSRLLDGAINFDEISMATASWSQTIWKTFRLKENSDGDPATAVELLLNMIFFPWRLAFSLVVPPVGYCGGWFAFAICMSCIGLMSSMICDFSELFGCCAGVEDYVTAITLVALGTSMPDLFVSATSAVQDEYADSSVVTVTGGDSARVFLGIGIPWTIAAIYWNSMGPTDEWKLQYGQYLDANPLGAFIVPGGMLGFNVIIYLITATPVLLAINVRRAVYGGELGGPFVPKIVTGVLFVLMWFFYLYMSIWKVRGGSDALGDILSMIWTCITTLEHVALVIIIMVFCCVGGSKEGKPDLSVKARPDEEYERLTEEGTLRQLGTGAGAAFGPPAVAYHGFGGHGHGHGHVANGAGGGGGARAHEGEGDVFYDCDADSPPVQTDPYYSRYVANDPAMYGGSTQNSGLVPNVLVAMAANKFKRSSSSLEAKRLEQEHQFYQHQQQLQLHQQHQQQPQQWQQQQPQQWQTHGQYHQSQQLSQHRQPQATGHAMLSHPQPAPQMVGAHFGGYRDGAVPAAAPAPAAQQYHAPARMRHPDEYPHAGMASAHAQGHGHALAPGQGGAMRASVTSRNRHF
eukprot:TRINITY_DN3337_c0_g5_i1.p1 TRINITY_DN3337_c0_g5~~TRINITY_DN3337_c0_g5_i1.p1  ORF type:complete len:971 (+),score=158.43 TRINITY_DN3337_c0_g5_i1:74-2986(+)